MGTIFVLTSRVSGDAGTDRQTKSLKLPLQLVGSVASKAMMLEFPQVLDLMAILWRVPESTVWHWDPPVSVLGRRRLMPLGIRVLLTVIPYS